MYYTFSKKETLITLIRIFVSKRFGLVLPQKTVKQTQCKPIEEIRREDKYKLQRKERII